MRILQAIRLGSCVEATPLRDAGCHAPGCLSQSRAMIDARGRTATERTGGAGMPTFAAGEIAGLAQSCTNNETKRRLRLHVRICSGLYPHEGETPKQQHVSGISHRFPAVNDSTRGITSYRAARLS
jgi:hypothetical protein